jgi:abortive infection bacteriophage resistance protein
MKPWKSLQEQLELLESRGMVISDDELAKHHLSRMGYYRLSGYAFAFRQRVPVPNQPKKTTRVLDDFVAGAQFKNIVDLYVFDKSLRLLAMDALERIEVAMRSQIAHVLGAYDPVAYLESKWFHHNFTKINKNGLSLHHEWLAKQARLVSGSKEEFMVHHKEKYGLPVPIWVACEVWDFGAMSHLFAGMTEVDQDKISIQYGVQNGRTFATWLRSLNYLRNVCAHHGRLWNRNVVDVPKLPPSNALAWVAFFEKRNQQGKIIPDEHLTTRVFLLLCICAHLLMVLCPNTSWIKRLKKLMDEFPDISNFKLNLLGMGAKNGWEQILDAF